MKKKSILVLSLIITLLILIVGCTPTTPTTGIIEVNSTPAGAKVYLDGVDTGMATPFTFINKEAGTYVIKLDAFRYKIWEENVIVIANETTYLNPFLTHASTQYSTLQPDSAEGKDAAVSSRFPESEYGSWPIIDVGNTAAGTILRSYIQFDLSSVPENARVIYAYLDLYQYATSGTEKFIIDLHKVTSEWQEGTINWNSQPTYSTEAEDSVTITVGEVTGRYWYINDLVQGWLNGTISNYGMALIDADETSVDTLAYFYSSDYIDDTAKRPKLEIDYYIP